MTIPRTRPHLTESQLLPFLASDATLDEAGWVAAHAQECSRCASQLTDARAFRLTLRRALTTLPAPCSLRLDTPIGPLVVSANQAGIDAVRFGDPGEVPASSSDPMLEAAGRQLTEYFEGRRTTFDLPLDLRAAGDFQRPVLSATARIPAGSVLTYAQMARTIGRPGAARAVGGALNRNPLPILVPCHRVVGSSGKLVGYAGGIEAKRKLLILEGALAR